MDPGFVFEDGFDADERTVQDAWEVREAYLEASTLRPARGRSLDDKIRDQKDHERPRDRAKTVPDGIGRDERRRRERHESVQEESEGDGGDSEGPDVDSEEEAEEMSSDGSLDANVKHKDARKSEKNPRKMIENAAEEEEVHPPTSSDDEMVEDEKTDGGGGHGPSLDQRNGTGRTETKPIREFFDSKARASFSAKSFHELHLSRPLLKACAALGYETPTPIQAACIPLALTGRDICGSAVTGSGKTAAFSLPILERLMYRNRRVAATRVLVLVPTRELAVQVHGMISKLGQFTDIRAVLVVGGLNLNTQAAALRGRPDIIVGTPGRIIDHLRNTLSFGLEDLATLVLDEADRLLEMGFAQEVDQIVRMCPKGRQTLLFSATMTEEVRQLEAMSLKNPVRLSADASGMAPKDLTIEVIRVKEKFIGDKEAMLLSIVTRSFKSEVIIFTRTKQQAHRLNLLFGLSGLKASELHGNMTQAQRLEALEKFRNKESSFLIATDVAARGLDIIGVKTVINYDSPKDLTSFLHRVGRTARAGRAGCAITFAENTDKALIKMVQKHTGKKLQERAPQTEDVKAWHARIEGMEGQVNNIRMEEREERAIRRAEMEAAKAENMMLHESEIYSRPARTWFQTAAEKKALKKAMSSDAKGSAAKRESTKTKKAVVKEKATGKNKGKGEKRERPKSEDDAIAERAGREAKRIKSYEKQLRQQGLAPNKAMLLARQKAGAGKLHGDKGTKDRKQHASSDDKAGLGSAASLLPRSKGRHTFKSKSRYKRR